MMNVKLVITGLFSFIPLLFILGIFINNVFLFLIFEYFFEIFLLNFLIICYFLINVIRSKKIKEGSLRTSWFLGILIGNAFVIPFYWFFYFYKNK